MLWCLIVVTIILDLIHVRDILPDLTGFAFTGLKAKSSIFNHTPQILGISGGPN